MKIATAHMRDDGRFNYEEAEANARLIAASPALYDFAAKKAAQGDQDAISMLALLKLSE